jgi:hypothetical protein
VKSEKNRLLRLFTKKVYAEKVDGGQRWPNDRNQKQTVSVLMLRVGEVFLVGKGISGDFSGCSLTFSERISENKDGQRFRGFSTAKLKSY